MMLEDCDFDQQLISERIPDVEQLVTQRSIEPKPNPSLNSIKQLYPDFNVSKLLLETTKQPLGNKNTQSILLRSMKFQQQKQQKLKQIAQQNNKNVMKQCTFRPKVNKSFGDRKRTVKQFLESQDSFLKKVDAKRDQMKKVLKQSVDQTMKTKFHKKHHTSNSELVYDRLYKRSKENIIREDPRQRQPFAPLISARSKNIPRDLPISEHLYTDALRRKEDQTTRQSMRTTYTSQTPRPLSMKTQMYAGQKFIKQFYYTIHQLQVQEPLTFESFFQLIQRLGFATVTYEQALSESENKQVLLVQEAFHRISQIELSLRNLCVLLLALLGIHYVNPVESIDVPLLTLSLEESKKLKQHFDLLYRNRLSMQQLRKTIPTEQLMFQPIINQKSQVLAEIRRHKILQQTSALLEKNQYQIDINSFNHVDLLHLNRINKEIEIMKRREENRQKDMRQCTFYPQTTWKTEEQDTEAGVRKCDQLYKLAKQLGDREPRTGQDVQFQKNKDQCTFKPKINKQKKTVISQPAKNFEKTIVRMHQARKTQQEKNKKLRIPSSRPSKNTSSNTSYQTSVHEIEEQPFLVIDINIGESIEQLVIFKKDLGKEAVLARQFAIQHKIDMTGEERLTHLLKQEVNAIMNKIEEEEEEYEVSSLA